jgi:exocyst complex component 3
VQQHYHVRFAQVVDHVGRAAERLSTKSLLKIMGWVSQYQDTLRNLGVEEVLVHLPIAPQSDPEGRPGLKLLIEVYTGG